MIRQRRLPLAFDPEPAPEPSRCEPSAIASEPPGAYVLVRIGASLVPVPAADITEKVTTTTENTET